MSRQASRWMRWSPLLVAITSLNSPFLRLNAASSKAVSPCPREIQPRSPHSCQALSAVEHSECSWQSLRNSLDFCTSRSLDSTLPPVGCMQRRPFRCFTNSPSASSLLLTVPALAAALSPVARGRRAKGSSGRLLPGSAQRNNKWRTRTERGPGMPFCFFAGRLAAKKSLEGFASLSSSVLSRMQAQMTEAEESFCLLGNANAMFAHWRAATLGCH
mmetsp:Transcript_88180/g.175088  ORF Transcript_88180/g.175088 Transcript_88180/m.175088 type:complete len:216 (-) Transcript_88180:1677-2324(-)